MATLKKRIKEPVLLKQTGEINKILPHSKISITFNCQSPHQATIIMPDRPAVLHMHDFVRLYNQNGDCGVYRYTGENETIKKERQITLKHAIDTLQDAYYTAETDYSGTVRGWLEEILSKQSMWVLGDCEDDNEFIRKGVSYDKLSDLFWEVITREHDFYPEYDCHALPYTVHIRRLPTEVGAQLRLRRNVLSGLRITRNDKNMCNLLRLRVTTQKADEEVNEERTYQDAASQEKYGIIEKRETVFTDDVSNVDAWAERYLAERNRPTISISAPAVDLYAQTMQTWDEFSVGKLAQVALPDYGEVHTERVTSVVYPDVYGTPNVITVNMATNPKTLSDSVREAMDTASRSAGGVATAQKELTYWEMRVSKIKMAQDATGITEMYVTGIELDAETGAKIYSIKQGFVAQRAEIIANSEAIQLRVQKNGVIAAINVSSEEVQIDAARIKLNGYVTTSQLNATEASLKEAYAKDFTTTTLKAQSANLQQLLFKSEIVYEKTLSIGSAASIPVLTTSASTISFNHKHTATVNSDGSVTIGGAIAI